MKDCKKGKEQAKMGSLPEIQLSADTGEGTGGRKVKQKVTIEFYIIFFYASTLFLYVSVCRVRLAEMILFRFLLPPFMQLYPGH